MKYFEDRLMNSDEVNEARLGTEASGLREESPGDDAESVQPAVSEDSLFAKSILDFGEDKEVHIRKNGLSLPGEMPFESWRQLGSRIIFIADCSAWWIGDWLVYGEQAYGDRYEQAITDTSLGYQTLRNYAWVARKFPTSRRRDTLSFGHHAEVAALPGDEQDKWLARAEQLSWSRNRLRRGLRAAKVADRQAASENWSVSKAVKIDVPTERHDRWQSAAERKRCSVADWIIATLDRAANDDLATETPSEVSALAEPQGQHRVTNKGFPNKG
jgi:hypothetical protein